MQLDPLPSECLVDQSLEIRVRGLPAGAPVRFRLYNSGFDGSVWLSQAEFVAGVEGVVDLSLHAPTSGSYQGADSMGLFWSRAPVTGQEADACHDVSTDPLTVTLAVDGDGNTTPLRHSIRRMYASAGVVSRDVREDGIVGRMFEPAGCGPHPAVLVVGGSNGGLFWSREVAALLASHGYAALALAYFAAEGLPPTLDRIRLEYFKTALDWLAVQPCVAPEHIGISGVSRGGELALLLGATFPRIKAVVAYVPSGIVWPGYPPSGHGAWTWGGKEIAYAQTLTHAQWDVALAEGRARPDSFDWYFIPLQDEAYAASASIPVERINGPVLLISGKDDAMWPSTELADFAVRRLQSTNFPHRFEHLGYDGAGHGIAWPNVATTMTKFKHQTSGEEVDLGGSPAATALASRESWTRMLAFLDEALRQSA